VAKTLTVLLLVVRVAPDAPSVRVSVSVLRRNLGVLSAWCPTLGVWRPGRRAGEHTRRAMDVSSCPICWLALSTQTSMFRRGFGPPVRRTGYLSLPRSWWWWRYSFACRTGTACIAVAYPGS